MTKTEKCLLCGEEMFLIVEDGNYHCKNSSCSLYTAYSGIPRIVFELFNSQLSKIREEGRQQGWKESNWNLEEHLSGKSGYDENCQACMLAKEAKCSVFDDLEILERKNIEQARREYKELKKKHLGVLSDDSAKDGMGKEKD